jgi:hypothetical protein
MNEKGRNFNFLNYAHLVRKLSGQLIQEHVHQPPLEQEQATLCSPCEETVCSADPGACPLAAAGTGYSMLTL